MTALYRKWTKSLQFSHFFLFFFLFFLPFSLFSFFFLFFFSIFLSPVHDRAWLHDKMGLQLKALKARTLRRCRLIYQLFGLLRSRKYVCIHNFGSIFGKTSLARNSSAHPSCHRFIKLLETSSGDFAPHLACVVYCVPARLRKNRSDQNC